MMDDWECLRNFKSELHTFVACMGSSKMYVPVRRNYHINFILYSIITEKKLDDNA